MLSLHGDIFLKIPLDIAVNKYLGFTPMNSWESASRYSNPKYLFPGYRAGRYHREEIIFRTIDVHAEPNNSASRIAAYSTRYRGRR